MTMNENNEFVTRTPRCSKPEGHEDHFAAFIGGVVITFSLMMVGFGFYLNGYENWAIRNGFAQYDQTTGKLIWKDDKK